MDLGMVLQPLMLPHKTAGFGAFEYVQSSFLLCIFIQPLHNYQAACPSSVLRCLPSIEIFPFFAARLIDSTSELFRTTQINHRAIELLSVNVSTAFILESAYQMQKTAESFSKTTWLSFCFVLGEAMLWNGHDGQQHGISSRWKQDYSVLLFLPSMASMPAKLKKPIASHRPT